MTEKGTVFQNSSLTDTCTDGISVRETVGDMRLISHAARTRLRYAWVCTKYKTVKVETGGQDTTLHDDPVKLTNSRKPL